MMKFNQYHDIKKFYDDVYENLKTHESQNMILMGNVKMGYEGKMTHDWRNPAEWVMATVTDDEKIFLTALMTPPFGITLYATDNLIDNKVLNCLVDGLEGAGISVPGVMSEKGLAEKFAEVYSHKKGVGFEVNFNQRIYELKAVSKEVFHQGNLRLVNEKDMAFLPYWIEGITGDIWGDLKSVQDDPKHYAYQIATNNVYVLEIDGMPVSMAKISRECEQICGIGYVYTPPYFRGKGYASACVAKLSQVVLDRGFSGCVLYTDLANPTSNSIYQKIGYHEVCDSVEIKFL